MVRRALWVLLFAAIVLTPIGPPAGAVDPDEILDDPLLEARARDLSAEVRCLVCQNESIDSSNAELARELRILIRERLVAGDTDDGVKAYLVARYGEFVLLRPPLKPSNYLLWFSPFVLLLLVLFLVRRFLMRQGGARPAQATALDAGENARLEAILAEDERDDSGGVPKP